MTINPSTMFPVRRTMRPVIRNDMSPRVRKLRGNVSIRANPPIRRFTIANTIPTIIAVQKESTSTPGTIMAATATAIHDMRNSIRSAIHEKIKK